MMFWYDHDMGWWGYAGMGIGMVLFWTLIIAGIVALVIFLSGDGETRQPPPSPDQILAGRFARGEINETEYRDRLAVLCDPAGLTRSARHLHLWDAGTVRITFPGVRESKSLKVGRDR